MFDFISEILRHDMTKNNQQVRIIGSSKLCEREKRLKNTSYLLNDLVVLNDH